MYENQDSVECVNKKMVPRQPMVVGGLDGGWDYLPIVRGVPMVLAAEVLTGRSGLPLMPGPDLYDMLPP